MARRSGVSKRWLSKQCLSKQCLSRRLSRRWLSKRWKPQPIVWVGLLAFCLTGIAVGQWMLRGNPAQAQSTVTPEVIAPSTPQDGTSHSDTLERDFALTLPPPQVHPLPPGLAEWQDASQQGDYFDAVQSIPVGYLIWSRFPVQIYIEPVGPSFTDQASTQSPTSQQERDQAWYAVVQQAIQEWQVYLPLSLTSTAEAADITIWRSAPPLRLHPIPSDADQHSGAPAGAALDRLPRVRAAETRYEIVIRSNPTVSKLEHRFTIYLSPNQTQTYTLATARHELGHALGIWGHSSQPTDALYFSQVRDSPTISVRDVNTLKRIYEQPTRLGWALPSP